GVVVEQGVVAVEGADVLGQGVEEAAQGRPRLAVRRVRVGGSNDLGPGRMHLRVDDERGRVDGTITFDDVALVVDQDQVGHLDLAEVHSEGVDPEVILELGVARRDVAGDPFVEPEPREQPEGGGQPLLAVKTLVLDGVEGGRSEPARVHSPRLRAYARRPGSVVAGTAHAAAASCATMPRLLDELLLLAAAMMTTMSRMMPRARLMMPRTKPA